MKSTLYISLTYFKFSSRTVASGMFLSLPFPMKGGKYGLSVSSSNLSSDYLVLGEVEQRGVSICGQSCHTTGWKTRYPRLCLTQAAVETVTMDWPVGQMCNTSGSLRFKARLIWSAKTFFYWPCSHNFSNLVQGLQVQFCLRVCQGNFILQ